MKNLKIKKIELTLFEIKLSNILEDRGGIGIKYSPGQKGYTYPIWDKNFR